MKGQKFLKVTGILMIIGGAIAIVGGIIAILGVSALAYLAGDAGGTGLLYTAAILCTVSGAAELIAGIMGVKHSKNPAAAKKCIVWGVIVAVLSIAGNILTVVGGGGFQITSLILGLALPILYIIGAYMNSKENAAQ